MSIRLLVYAAAVLTSTFAVSGINFNGLIKTNHVWEARFLAIILICCFSYILTNFIYDVVDITAI